GEAMMRAELCADVTVAVGNLTKAKQNPQMKDFNTEGQFLFITTDGKPAQALPPAQPVATPAVAVNPQEQPSNKLRAVVMEVSIAGVSGSLPSQFDERLMNLLSDGLMRLVNKDKVSIIERKALELINQQRHLTGSGDKIPGADIIISA